MPRRSFALPGLLIHLTKYKLVFSVTIESAMRVCPGRRSLP